MQTEIFARSDAQRRESHWLFNLATAAMPCWRALTTEMRGAAFTCFLLMGSIAGLQAAAPVLTPPANTTIIEDSGRTNIAFTVTDDDTPFFSVTVTARSSNTNLVPSTNIVFVGSGTSRTVGITPKANGSGTSTISLIANDGATSVTNTFVLTVTGVNDGPTIGSVTNITILEDAAATNRTVIVTDVDTPMSLVTLTATSSNTNLVRTLVTGSSTNRTLRLTASSNAVGTATITLVANDGSRTDTNSFTVTTTAVNDAPRIATLTPFTMLEDVPTNRTVVISDVDSEITNVTMTAESLSTNIATVSISGTATNRTLTMTPGSNAVGTATIRLIADDGDKRSTNTFVLTVAPVNDIPSFSIATNLITLAEDAGVYNYTNFATGISTGPTNEATQTKTFVVTSTNAAFFATQPSISSTGLLSFRVATNVFGTNTLSMVLRDSGGTNSGGVAQSLAQTLTLVITPSNDAPFITTNAPLVIREDAGVTNRTITLRDVDTTISVVTLAATISNTNLATVATSGSSTNRTLTITTLTNMNGSATITLIANDGSATWTNSFPLTVTAINDRPTFTLTTNLLTVAEDSGDFTLANFATNMLSGPSDESGQTNVFVLTVTNTAFFATLPAITTNGTLTFRPGVNRVGTNNVKVTLRDNFGTTNGGLNLSLTQQFAVVVTGQNDAPVIAGISAFTINEDSGRTNKTFTVTDADNVISNITVTAFSSDTNIVTVALSGTTTNRTLAVTTVTNAFGAPTISIVASDGSAASTNSFTLTVTGVNDGPVLSSLTNVTVLEDSAATGRTVVVTDLDNDIGDVTVTATSSATNVATVNVTGSTTNRTLTVTPATNGVGTSTITYIADDGARTATNSFTVTITAVNDAPEFTLSTNTVVVAEDSGAQSIASFLTGIASGPSNESTETNFFVVTTTNSAFFATQPAISPSGVLSFVAATNTAGTNQITVVMWDNGGTNNSGVNQSAAQNFNIVVTAANDAPVLSGLAAFSINEDAATNASFVVTDVDTDLSSVTVTASSSDTNLVTVGTTGSSTNRTLDVTPAADRSGTATLTLVTTDGSASTTNTLLLTVNSANDAPSFTLNTNIVTLLEDSGPFSLADFATNLVAGPTNESAQTLQFVVVATNSAFFSTQPAIAANGTLTFVAATNAFGTNTIQVQIQDNGGTNNTGIDISAVQTFDIVVTGTNDAPVLSGLVSLTIDEDSGETNLVFNVEDTDTTIASVTVAATSSDTNIVTVAVTGSDTNRTLTITTVTNGAGSVTITLVADDTETTTTNTMSLTVTGANDLPIMEALTNLVVLEDVAPVVRTVLVSDADDAITNVTVTAVSSDTNILAADITGTDTNRTLTLTPATNAFGTVTVTLVANDGTETTTNEFEFEITSVNDAPLFTLSTNLVTIAEDSGLQSIASFLTGIASGPANESAETNDFTVSTTNTAFFATQPAISTNGTLTFTVATNTYGTNEITVVMNDSGGTDDGGTNQSAAQTFEIVVTAVNDTPAISGLANFTIREDAGTTNRAFILTDVDSDMTNVTVTATSSDTNVFTVATSGSSTNRTLDITTVTNVFGSATVTLITSDSTDSATNSIVVTISSVNDQPTFTLTTNLVTVLEDSGAFSLANLATNIVVGPSNESSQTNFFLLTVTNTAFYSTQPAISPAGALTFQPSANSSGTNNITVYLRDSGGATNTGVNTSAAQTLQIVVTATNDAPTIAGLSALTIDEDAGTTNQTFTVTDPDTAIGSVTLTATSSDTNVVTVSVSGTTTNRTLAIVTVADGAGAPTITVVANDGTDSTTNTFTLTVTAINDGPTLGVLTNLAVLEDSGPTDRTVVIADADTAITNVVVTATSSDTNIATVSIAGTSTNRTMTLTPATNMFGTATITFAATDGSLATTNSFVLTVSTVNDAPTFTLTTNTVAASEDTGVFTLANFVTNIVSGPSNESAQTNYFVVTAADTSFFTNQPAITPAGTLTFRAKTNTFGTNQITVVLWDNGGTTNSGVNQSASQTFDIVVSDVNDLPILSTIAGFTIREDAAVTNKTFTVRDADTDMTNVVVTATSSDTNLVSLAVSGTTTNRTLAITTLTNANGSATITLVADDGSGTVTNSFALTVSAVNDVPAFTVSTSNVTVTEYATLVTLTNFVTGIASGPTNESSQVLTFLVTAGNTNSFTVQPSITTNGTLTFQAKDVAGAASVSVRLQDDGGSTLGGTNATAAQTFTVTVPANPFVALAGQFNGLFYETNGVLNSSAGYMNFTLTTNGAYTGYVLLAGGSNTFSGRFLIAGSATNTITRTNGGDMAVSMALDLTTNFTESATGTLTHSNWTAVLTVDRATFDSVNNPTLLVGDYNIMFPGSANAALPEGYGFGLVAVEDDGTVSLSGELSDGTAVEQVTGISRDGVWPLYVSLYNGEGVVLGWVTFASTATNDLSGDATWIKESTVGGVYGSGFTNDFNITGSYYVEQEIGTTAINLTSGTVTLSGGDLSTPINTSVTLNVDHTVTIDPLDVNALTFSIDIANGTFSGSFLHPDLGTVHSFDGVLLQSSTNAVGYFLTPAKSGAIILH